MARAAPPVMALAAVLATACTTDSRPRPVEPAGSDFTTLSEDVEVRRDEWGVPHIYAHQGPDAAFVLGYETARDRLFQLDVNRRRALGRMAELFGEASRADDLIARTIGFGSLGDAGEQDLAAHDPEVHRALEAYAEGISVFISDAQARRNGARLPPEYADVDPDYRPEPWRVADTIALVKAELFLLAAHPESDLLSYAITATAGADVYRDFYRPDPLTPTYITPGFPAGCGTTRPPPATSQSLTAPRLDPAIAIGVAESFARFSGRKRIGPVGASNNWALCGSATASGGGMLANDPHLDVDLPTNFYEFHLESDEPGKETRVAGFGFAGAPAVALGHDETSAWGVTTVEADVADSYVETIEGDSVRFDGALVPLEQRTEIIRVRSAGGSVSEFDEVPQVVRVVPHHGPILTDAVAALAPLLSPSVGISLRWLGFDVTHEPRAFYDLMRVHSYEDFRAALGNFEAGLFNFVYADHGGDIGYYPHASYPIREQLDPSNPPYGVLPGTGGYEWTGALIPERCIPQAHQPSSCRLWSSNNDPAGVTADGDVLDDAYYLGGTFDYGFRAARVGERLAALSSRATLDDFESIQGDVQSGLAEHFLSRFLAAAGTGTLSPAASHLVDLLSGWDRTETVTAVPPTAFAALYSQILVDVFADDLPGTFASVATDDRTFAPVLSHLLAGEPTPSKHDYLGGKTPDQVVVAALEEIAVSLPAALGADETKWAWGLVHTNTFNHPLGGRYNLGPVALGGGLSTVSSGRYSPTNAGAAVVSPDVTEAPNVRLAVDLGGKSPTMRAVLATGESGVLGDAHYADQLALFAQPKLRECHFDRADVVAHAPRATVFPAGYPITGAPTTR